MKRSTLFACLGVVALYACSHHDDAAPTKSPVATSLQTHSSPIAISPDGARLFVAHADADSVSVIDVKSRAIVKEIPLGAAPPAQDPTTQRFDPAVSPRALALDPTGATLFVTGQRSSTVYAIDVASLAITTQAPVCSEPIGVLVDAAAAHVFVACSNDDAVVELDRATLATIATVTTPHKPWSLAWEADGATLVATHLLGPGYSTFDTSSALRLTKTFTIADGAPGKDATVPHGVARGMYDAVPRPGTSELWIAHVMLGIDTPQPTLDFLRTVFPAVSIFDAKETQLARLTASTSVGDGNAFGDVLSGPRAMAFSSDGKLAFVVNTDSEDVVVVDADARVEAQIVRPLPGHMPEGIVVGPDGEVYVYERNSEDVVAFHVTKAATGPEVAIDGAPIPALAHDPMPATLRTGQKLFYSANSSDAPVTTDHWVACASCHLEGRSDAVTWLFEQGPRDTPSNAGGTRDTGFLFRTAARNQVQDYWKTINVEQGGHFSLTDPVQAPLLDALAAYVNQAIPVPIAPRTDAALRSKGEQLFNSIGCTNCHSGPARTDSGAGNPTLAMEGTILLHDVGTCVKSGTFPDAASQDKDGNARDACSFDTPSLRGLWDSAPYYHDGSALTLDDVLTKPDEHAAALVSGLSADDRKALLEFLKSL